MLTRVGELRFGTIAIERPVTRLTEARHGFFTSTELAGNIGNGVLERFTVTFDYRRREMSFEPRRAAPDYVADRSGMWVIRTNAGVAVVDVASGTPAAQAGLSAGDVIVRVDGDPASDLSLADLRAHLRSDPGTVVVLRIKRGAVRSATQRSCCAICSSDAQRRSCPPRRAVPGQPARGVRSRASFVLRPSPCSRKETA